MSKLVTLARWHKNKKAASDRSAFKRLATCGTLEQAEKQTLACHIFNAQENCNATLCIATGSPMMRGRCCSDFAFSGLHPLHGRIEDVCAMQRGIVQAGMSFC